MFKNLVRGLILSLVLSIIPSNFQVANSTEILWNPGLGNDFYTPENLVPGAKIRNTGVLIYKSNPDELIMKVVMDDSNNTPDVIDRNQLVGQIYLQPTKTAEFIYLNFNILPTGATFPT